MGIPRWSSGQDSMLSLPRVQVQSLVRERRSCLICLVQPKKTTGDAFKGSPRVPRFLANVVFDNNPGSSSGVYAVINKTCRTCINNSAEVEINTQEIYEHLNGYVGSATPLPKLYGTQSKASSYFIPWFLPLLGPLVVLVLLPLFRACLFNL